MKKAEKVVEGYWRITGMEVWAADYFDMEVPARITVRNDLTGQFQFGLVQGDIDARVSMADGVLRVDFSWSGFDENDPMSGRGWMQICGNQAEGRIFIHLGDDSAFTAVRQEKVKPVADAVKRLRRVK
jgi:hypothetical protein